METKTFKSMGIKTKTLTGEKITLNEILDKEITVYDYRIEDSKYGKRDAKCLWMQLGIGGEIRVVFTGSTVLMDTLQQVPTSGFPFTTTIIKERDWYKFT